METPTTARSNDHHHPQRGPFYVGGPNLPDRFRRRGQNDNDNISGGRQRSPSTRQQGEEQDDDDKSLEEKLRERFNKEPDSIILCTTGWTICLPKYNGVAWWYPQNTTKEHQQQHALETALCCMFRFVESMQTILLFVWPISLAYDFGVVRAMASIPLTVPIGSHLEDNYESNHGNAVSCLHALYLSFHWISSLYSWGVVAPDTNPNPLVFLLFFVIFLYVIGNISLAISCA